jgi:hypothetical protein
MELPESNGYNAIFVAVDRLGKRIHIMPTTTEVNSKGIVDIWLERVWSQHGLSEGVISDWGPQFVSKFMKAVFRLLGIQSLASTAFHPQTDGQTERINQEIELFLRAFVNERQDDWAKLLPMVEFAYNNHVHSSMQQTLFFTAHSEHPQMGFEPVRPGNVQAAADFADRMRAGLEEAKSALQKATEDMKRFYNRHHDGKEEFQVGDKVWLDTRYMTTTRPAKKLDDRWFGPFPVEVRISWNVYRLKLPASMKVHPVFHISLLRRFVPDIITGRQAPPPPKPVVVQGQEEYEVEEILNSRRRWNRLEYLVKWKGYSQENNTWEPAGNVSGAPVRIREFHRRFPDAAR